MSIKGIFGRRKGLGSRGDTLVEVLIAIGVISSVLAGAYVVTNKSLTSSRDAQERGNALKISEGQLERLKVAVAANSGAIYGFGAPFCLSSANAPVAISNAACKVDALGAPTGGTPQYQLSIDRVNNTFTLTTTWTNVRGTGQDTVRLSYKVYQ